MVFSSMLFVFLFLPANLLSQIFLKTPKQKNIAMLVFSLVFYSWAGIRYLLLLLGMVFICWVGAILVQLSDGRYRRLWMWITVGLCLLILGIFKYTGFFLQNAQNLIGVPKVVPNIVLPIGISFYTFQLISYVVDVYRGEVPAQNKYWMLLLYASLFHQCIAGPIVRYQDVQHDLVKRKTDPAEVARGVSRFAVGLAKKAVLANGCAAVADQLLTMDVQALAALPAMGVLLGAFAYMLQIYLDFSAYSDMAIGMGLMCGLHYRENFNYPYISGSITELWRRWHISLGSFFADYVYIPLGGSRCSMPRQLRNLLVVWFLTGMWHGASWNYIFWGLFFGVLLALERYVFGGQEGLRRIPGVIRHVCVLVLFLFSLIIFKFTDLSAMGVAVKGLFGLNQNGFSNTTVRLLLQNNIFFLAFSAVACTPLGKKLAEAMRRRGETSGFCYAINTVWEAVYPPALLILSAMALVGDSYNPFIYFQF